MNKRAKIEQFLTNVMKMTEDSITTRIMRGVIAECIEKWEDYKENEEWAR